MRVLSTVILTSLGVLPIAFAQSEGLPPEWEVRKNMESLAESAKRFRPILEEVKPEDWAAKGAPAGYQRQWKSVVDETGFLIHSSEELAKEPERLTLALETLFRMQAVDAMLASMDEGVRKYQNPALADLLRSTMSDAAAHVEKLRQYIVSLAAAKEDELKVMDQEAQRCRAELSRRPAKEPPKNTPEPK